MTPWQWLFHYYEICKFNNLKFDLDKTFIDDIVDKIEVLWVMANPDLGKELLDIKNKAKMNVEDKHDQEVKEETKPGQISLDFTPEGFHDTWRKIIQKVPTEYLSETEEMARKRKFILPTFSREDLEASSGITVTE